MKIDLIILNSFCLSKLLRRWSIFIIWSVRRVSLAAGQLINVNIVWSKLSFIVFHFSRGDNSLVSLILFLLFLFISAPVYLFWLKIIVLKPIFIFLDCISLRSDIVRAIIDFELELVTLANCNESLEAFEKFIIIALNFHSPLIFFRKLTENYYFLIWPYFFIFIFQIKICFKKSTSSQSSCYYLFFSPF